jgi:hypothetical protein
MADGQPVLPDRDRIRIAEAHRLFDALGDRVWPGWDKAPFAILLVTPDHEFLIGHPAPSDDFESLGEDPVLKKSVLVRKRTYPTGYLATFPAVGGVPTIVVGQAENTSAETSVPWLVTVLHEHFHQMQYSRPGYYAGVDALDLSGGDESGMWMLDYAFPYDDPEVAAHFADLSKALLDALRATEGPDFERRFAAYLEARVGLRSILEAADARYLAFQLWQEGIARYTEIRLAELASESYEPGPELRNLSDFTSFEDVARSLRDRIDSELESARLGQARRTAFYAVGAAEGLLLDRARPGWQERYFDQAFTLDGHFGERE